MKVQEVPNPGPTSTVAGTITAFGSVFVNGIEFTVNGDTDITLDGSSGAESDLRIGMTVTVRGKINDDGATGTALNIEFNDNLQGPVDSIDVPEQTLVVLGQTVIVDAATVFESGVTLSTLDPGNVVEISGLTAAGGSIRATRIELISTSFTPVTDTIELKGKISDLNASAKTFKINGQAIDFSDSSLENLPGGILSNGLLVEVRSTAGFDGSALLAGSVEAIDDTLPAAQGDRVEVEGLVTRFDSESVFDVDGVPVSTSGQTTFQNGTAADLALDVRVEVEGVVNGDGILVAEKVSFR